MTEDTLRPRRPSRLMVAGAWLGGIAALGGILGMACIAIEKIIDGHGLDTYRTFWLVEFNWISFLVFLAAVVVALGIGMLFWLKERREVRQLLAKYSGDRHG